MLLARPGHLSFPTPREVTAAMSGWLPDAATEGRNARGGRVAARHERGNNLRRHGRAAGAAGTAASGAAQSTRPGWISRTSTSRPLATTGRSSRWSWSSSGRQDAQVRRCRLPQDACAAGRVASFGKESDPCARRVRHSVRRGPGAERTTALVERQASGRLLDAARRLEPATGAGAYEVQWSRTEYPWRAQGSKTTYSTSRGAGLGPASGTTGFAASTWADAEAADDLVDAGQASGREAEFHVAWHNSRGR